MNLIQRIKAAFLPTVVNPVGMQTLGFNNGVTIYPTTSSTYIDKGYNKNAWVYSIVSKCAKKFSQVPWYHYRIKPKEQKTWFDEYIPLTKGDLSHKALIEARKMRTKAVDQVIVNSPIQKLLSMPNRNQSGAKFREQLYGYKLLTGEGNIWLSRTEDSKPPQEMFIIPKPNLAVINGEDPWDIKEYKLLFGGREFINSKDNIIMWINPGYEFDPYTLSHLRGMAPLNAGALTLQSSNEAAERMIAMNKNQGVAGLAFNKSDNRQWTPEQAQFNRRQFNSIVNDKDLAGSIAYMAGEYGFIQFGLDAGQLKLLEQSDVQFKALCNIFDIPWQLFGTADSYENRKQYKRDFVYDNIAVASYELRDELNAKLIREFNLDRERDVIDCGITDLPELAEDIEKQAAFIEKMGPRLTFNEGRELLGWDRSPDPNMDKHYIQSGYESLDQLNSEMGGNLNNDISLLGG